MPGQAEGPIKNKGLKAFFAEVNLSRGIPFGRSKIWGVFLCKLALLEIA